ncbi:MAG: hypothetical protein ACK4K7_15355 [Allosphingosinicella sp.]|uniref:hypothetical protein n=1 Tax=Allosphingosinicella sp. TaxID=2823234 RepID=UPI0039627E29
MTSGDERRERPAALAPFPEFLFRPARPWSFILKAWLLSLAGSILLSVLAGAVAPEAAQPDLGPVDEAWTVFLLVLVVPAVETAFMVPPLLLLNRFLGPAPAVFLSAVGWGVAHSLAAPIWGFVAWWPFLLMSIAFLTWRERGFWLACGIVVAIHALQNSFAAAAILLGGASGA